MSLLTNRNVAFTIENQTYTVPAHATVKNVDGVIQVLFEFNIKTAPIDVQFVTAYRDLEHVKMVSERGNEFSKGPLYDQLIVWFNDLRPQVA